MLKIQKSIVLFCVILMMGYLLIIPSAVNYKVEYELFVMLFGVLAWGISLLDKISEKDLAINNELARGYHFIDTYLIWYLLVIFIEAIITWEKYGYTFFTLLNSVMPYMYIVFAFTLINIFVLDGGYAKFLHVVSNIGFVMLMVRFAGWYLYNFKSNDTFMGLVLETPNWIRNGLQRVDVVPLFGIIFVFYWFKFLTGTNKKRYFLISLIMVLYLIFVTQVRYQLLVIIVVALIMLYKRPPVRNTTIFKFTLFLAFLIVVMIGGINFIIDLFSINSSLGSSTGIRIEAIHYFANLIEQRHSLLTGLGLLSQWNINASQILQIPQQSMYYRGVPSYYYLTDLGIMGCFIQFGLLSIILYGLMFIKFFRTLSIKTISENDRLFLSGIILYLALSCISLNIFDLSRSFDVPFYFGIIGYVYSKQSIKS